MSAHAVQARLAAALLAFAAGAAGIVVVVQLIRSEPGPVGTAAPPLAPAAPAGAAAIAGGRIPTPTDPGFPSPPYGAIVLAREAGSRALGLAVVPGKPRALVRVSVISPAGPGAAGLDVSVRFGGGPAASLSPCGAGCYQADVAGAGSARSASVSLGKSSYAFSLPGGPLPDGTRIVDRAAAVWRGLRTLVWRERLAGTPTDAIHTVYQVVAPDELSYTIAGGSSAVIIGGTRWDRPSPAAHWVRSIQDPPLRQPQPFWVGAVDARILGSGVMGGRKVWDVSFFDPTTPAWFEARIDKQNGRTLELWMTATSHFMHDVYGRFDLPLRLRPPTSE